MALPISRYSHRRTASSVVARNHRAGGKVEPRASRMGELLLSRHRHSGVSGARQLCGPQSGRSLDISQLQRSLPDGPVPPASTRSSRDDVSRRAVFGIRDTAVPDVAVGSASPRQFQLQRIDLAAPRSLAPDVLLPREEFGSAKYRSVVRRHSRSLLLRLRPKLHPIFRTPPFFPSPERARQLTD
jgi:hypothetical protein